MYRNSIVLLKKDLLKKYGKKSRELDEKERKKLHKCNVEGSWTTCVLFNKKEIHSLIIKSCSFDPDKDLKWF